MTTEDVRQEFSRVIQDEWEKIYGLCFRLTGSAPDAEDLCQEAFARAFKYYPKFEGRSHVSTWIYRITLNAWKNKLRAKKINFLSLFHKNDKSGSDDEFSMFDPKSTEPLPEERLEQMESEKILQKGLMSLSPEERGIVVLRDLEGKSYEELAELFQVPLGTIKSRLARARESLRLRLAPILKAKEDSR